MGRPGPATQAKRQRERAQKEKRKAKADERALRREQQKARNAERPLVPGQDPDLEGIVPGPQPPLFD